ncbi:MAG: serine/threonine-protein kinase [Acidobacteria bacterium]|nr:serine/threonine-protein kinase [Acidobacteriota bacterium]
MVGKTLGHYEILEPLGKGGMGEVYRARDTKLDRDVAIKVLPEDFAADPDRLARFEREAKLLASLNHTNIAVIHGLHRSDDTHFLAMELVAGDDLSKRIEAGPMPLDVVLRFARQLARALEAAHSAGVVHRDLKPANIRVTPGNEIKVLDFGLAKALATEVDGGDHDPALSPTVTSLGTMAGVILGTTAYMAPEQARGEEVDHRADIWAFGVVVYEMLTGAQLFTGKTVSDTMAQVLTRDPHWEAVPRQVRRLLRACLEREPENRLRDIGDAWLLVDESADEGNGSEAEGAARGSARRRVLWPTLGALALGAVLTTAALQYFGSTAPSEMVRFLEYPPDGTRFIDAPLPSPDGRHLAMVVTDDDGQTGVWVRSLADEAAHQIAQRGGPLRGVFWSPDSEELVLSWGDGLNRIRRDGGGNRLIASVPLSGVGTWAPGGDIFLSTLSQGIVRIPAAGGTPTPFIDEPGATYRSLDVAPDGPHLIVQQFGQQTGIYASRLAGGDLRMLLPGVNSRARFLGPDYLLYQENRVLLAQQIDAATLDPLGNPIPIAQNVSNAFYGTRSGAVSFVESAPPAHRLTWFDRHGNALETTFPVGDYREVHLSPDGTQVLYVDADRATGNLDLWLRDLTAAAPERFTVAPDTDHLAAFSPDGSEIVWEEHRGGDLNLMRRATDASSDPLVVRAWNRGGGPAGWSPDGEHVLYVSDDGGQNIWAVPMRDGGEPFPLIETEFDDADPQISPDGNWIAYSSNAPGTSEIYLHRLNGMELVGGPQRVSNGGGEYPLWRRDGTELFFISGTVLMVVDTALDSDRPAAAPRPLFDIGERYASRDFAVAPDGQSFLVITITGDAAFRPATVILNWSAGGQR